MGYFGGSGGIGFALGGGLAVVLESPCAFLEAYHAEFAAVELGVDVAEQVPDRPVDVGRGILELIVAAVLFTASRRMVRRSTTSAPEYCCPSGFQ